LADYTEARCSLDANGRRVWEWITERENSAARRLGTDSKFAPQNQAGKQQ